MAKEANPIPQGKYVPATRFGNLIFTAGMTPRNNGVLIRTGKVKASDDIAGQMLFYSIADQFLLLKIKLSIRTCVLMHKAQSALF